MSNPLLSPSVSPAGNSCRVELDLSLFREIYPQFAEMSDAAVEHWWGVACTLVDNTPASAIPENVRKPLLHALLCHLCALAQRGPDGVGRTTNATQGSVSIGMASALDQVKGAAWWTQTQCGATAYEMLKEYWVGGVYINGGPKY